MIPPFLCLIKINSNAIRLEGMGFVPTPVELRPVLSVLCWTLVTILNWWAPSLLSYGTSKVTPSLSWLSLFSSGFSDILSAALKEGRKSRENRGEGLGSATMASEGCSDSPVELHTLEGYRGVKRSRVVKYMASLSYLPILKAKREGMLFARSFDSLQSVALAHDLATYHLHGLRAVYNFTDVMRYALELSKTDRTVEVGNLER
ncbi:uncharacterized protein LOC110937408 [Helianthus annuus]|uniref:uncharacterized protein LOC110937408 n=1 Tax=Helianthus annuus TaxID=4232 RepID=UPI000B8EFFB4|nr:uncharacterized protein LOC110937408 [Helianthus annuus]